MATRYQAAYNSPDGAGDAGPTALQIIEDENLKGKLGGKAIFVTGCSSGIGIETARTLFTTGATLYLTARNLEMARTALPDLIVSERVHILELDLNSLDGVRACANDFLSKSKKLNVFIANAGIMASSEGHTKDSFETQFGTNHLAHFLLFNLLKPTLLSSSSPKFNSPAIFLSSIGHRYAEPKLDNLNLEGEYNE
jgi:NAD(P)-dependent dehydrogenase (short-subunit alcohol dehydrogenase family)